PARAGGGRVGGERDALGEGPLRRLARTPLEALVVDAERKRRDERRVLAVLYAPPLAIDARAEPLLGAVEEVGRGAGAVEADDVAGEQSAQQLAIRRQD